MKGQAGAGDSNSCELLSKERDTGFEWTNVEDFTSGGRSIPRFQKSSTSNARTDGMLRTHNLCMFIISHHGCDGSQKSRLVIIYRSYIALLPEQTSLTSISPIGIFVFIVTRDNSPSMWLYVLVK